MKTIKPRFAASTIAVLVILVGLVVASAGVATAHRPMVTLSGYAKTASTVPVPPGLPSNSNTVVSTSPVQVEHNVRYGAADFTGGLQTHTPARSHTDVIRNQSVPESIWKGTYTLADVTVTDAATGKTRRGGLTYVQQGSSGGDIATGTHGLNRSEITGGTGELKGAKGFLLGVNGTTGRDSGSTSYFTYYYEISVPAHESDD